MLLLTRSEVESLLDPAALIDAVAAAMADLSAGRASMPNRVAASVPEHDALLLAMPASVPSLGALSAKLVTLFPQNTGTATPTHQAMIVAFDPATGKPLALLDGTAITALRTAAASAVSVRLLAHADARVLTIVGTGVQAAAHLRCVPMVRPFEEIRVVGRSREKAAALGATVFESIGEALDGADVVCATTHPSADPVIRRSLLSPGTHVVSVGFDVDGIEVDAETVADALVVVESREAALAPPPSGSRDLAGIDDRERVVELGELVAGTAAGRTSDDQITLYKSVGVAVQDTAAAALVLERAAATGAGTLLSLE